MTVQFTIKLPLFLFSSQDCTCQRERWRRSSRRTCCHVGGKKTLSLIREHYLNLLTRGDLWTSCSVCHGLTSVEWLLIKGKTLSDFLPVDKSKWSCTVIVQILCASQFMWQQFGFFLIRFTTLQQRQNTNFVSSLSSVLLSSTHLGANIVI